MKKLLTLVLALIVLTAFPGLSVAQKAQEKKPAPAEKRMDISSPKLMTGKVIQVNKQEHTFTLVAKGTEYKFTHQKIEAVPKVGEVVDVTYTENPGGPMKAATIKKTVSNSL